MKKFVFTLQAVYGIALGNEKQQKALLKKAEEKLRALNAELMALYEAREEAHRRCALEMQQGTGATRLNQYSAYLESLEEAIEKKKQSIREAEKERERIIAALVEARKEVKTLENLKERQYEEYLEEVKREEEQAIGDVVSYQVAAK